ncbi:hypothetical protein [Candidatus Regiella endosymbiont of Tuberolachnus salignus]|uniref:hypothetical protein n=1 Tax=Candidatus Regiella endosymbiont of Tuberolachnus salignus TaxID=3077956 RepID=UPI0030D0DAEF
MTKSKKETAVTKPPSTLIVMVRPPRFDSDEPITAHVHANEVTRWQEEGWQHSEQGK